MGEHDERGFKEQLCKFPSSFDLEDFNLLTNEKLLSERDNLLSKLNCKFVILDEEIQLQNLVSYLSYLLGDIDNATYYNALALQKRFNNVIAIANRAWFHRKNGNFYQAQKDLEQLQILRKDDRVWEDAFLLAKGELAMSYASCGPKFYKKAVNAYESLLKGNSIPRNKDAVAMWNFDHGRCLRRKLNVFSSVTLPKHIAKMTMEKACKIICNVIQTSRLKTYQARSWCELGELAYTIEHHPKKYGNVDKYIPTRYIQQKVTDYFKTAIELDSEDFDVNFASGRYYRYDGMYEESIELLKKALRIRESSKVYHHYALTLKSKEKNRQAPQMRRYDDLSSDEEETVHTKLVSKSTRRTTQLIQTKEMEDVLHNFDKAIEQSTNYSAKYDKAYTLRQLRKAEDARKLLSDLASSLDFNELKISCLEQVGFCCLDLADAESNPQKQEEHKYNAICWIQNAIEVAAVIASKVNYSTVELRPLIPTVRRLLSDPDMLETNKGQIKILKRILKEHHEQFPVLEGVLSDENLAINVLIEECQIAGNTDEAVFLAVLKRFTAEKDDAEYKSDMNIILEAASNALSKGDTGHATIRYQIWYQLLKLRENNGRKIKEKDMFLMTDFETENLQPMCMIASWLNDICGLKVANSDEHCVPNRQTLRSLSKHIEASFAVIAVFKHVSREIEPALEIAINSLLSLPHADKPKFVIVKEDTVALPTVWGSVEWIQLPLETDGDNNDMVSAWISKLLKTILGSVTDK